MKKGLIAILLVLVGIFILGAINADKPSESQKKWEYFVIIRLSVPPDFFSWICTPVPIYPEEQKKILKNDPPPPENEMLNFLGEKGWELTSIIGSHSGETIYYFKRPQPTRAPVKISVP